MTKSYRSEPLAAIHETMEALHAIGAIDKQTMRNFDDACLTPERDLTKTASPNSGGDGVDGR